MRQEGAGSQRALQEWLQTQGESLTRLERTLEVNSERELAAAISRGDADVGPAPEHRHRVWPRLYALVAGVLRSGDAARGLLSHPATAAVRLAAIPEGRELAARLGGYDLTQSGKLVWSPQ